MTRVEFKLDARKAEDGLKRFAASMLDLRPFWPRVVPLFIVWMREQFESEGDFLGSPWAPLTPAYAAYKAQAYPGKGILVAEGSLRKAASSPRRVATARTLTLTIDDPKIGYHQEGNDRMPARPVLPEGRIPSLAQEALDSLAEDYVSDMARRFLK